MDLFDHNKGHSTQLPQPATDTPTLQQRYAQLQLPMASSLSTPEMRPASSFSSIPCSVGSQRVSRWSEALAPEMSSCPFPSMASFHRFCPHLEQQVPCTYHQQTPMFLPHFNSPHPLNPPPILMLIKAVG